MIANVKTISPVEAVEILETRNPYNYRTINMGTVDIYVKDMKSGNWKENGESIKFDTNGNLIDGQHRLMAVVQSEIPLAFVVVSDIDPSVASTIDIGRKRSIEQYLKWADKGYKVGATAIVQQVLTFDRECKHVGQSAQNSRISLMEIMDAYKDDYAGFNEAAVYGKTVNKECKAIKPREAGSIFYFLTRRYGWKKEVVERFFFNLYTCRANDRSIYRTTLDSLNGLSKGAAKMEEYISCFNAMVSGCKTLRREYSDFFLRPEICRRTIEK